MARKRTTPKDEVAPELAAQFGIQPTGGEATNETAGDVLTTLLESSGDDEEATEADSGELANLQGEFDSVAVLNRKKQALEAELKLVSSALQAQKERMMDAMEAQGTKQFRSVTGEGSCTVTERYDTTLNDPQQFIDWVKESHPELLVVHSQTRNKFIRENYRDEGIAADDPSFPPGVDVTPRRGLMVRGTRSDNRKKGKT